MSDAGGAGGAGGAGRGGSSRGGGGADGGGRSGGSDSSSNSTSADTTDSTTSASSQASSAAAAAAARAASSISTAAAHTGAVASAVGAAVSAVASAVSSLVSAAFESFAPAGAFANSMLGTVAQMLGMPASLVESRMMDVAYAALCAACPAVAMVDGLMSVAQVSTTGALVAGANLLATRAGMPGFVADALTNVAMSRLNMSQAEVAATKGVLDVARTAQQGFGAMLDKATQEMGQDFARQVAERVERAVPGATQGLARAGASVWRDAVQSGVQQLAEKSSSTLGREAPMLFGNREMPRLTQALAAAGAAPSSAREVQAANDPNNAIQQGVERYVQALSDDLRQALAH